MHLPQYKRGRKVDVDPLEFLECLDFLVCKAQRVVQVLLKLDQRRERGPQGLPGPIASPVIVMRETPQAVGNEPILRMHLQVGIIYFLTACSNLNCFCLAVVVYMTAVISLVTFGAVTIMLFVKVVR